MPDENTQSVPNAPQGPQQAPPAEESLDASGLNQEVNQARPEMVDHLATPGALEVEEMSASKELKELRERREQVKNSSMQEVSDADGADSNASVSEPFTGSSGGLIELLKEANLSPKHLRFCCSGVVAVFLLIALIFGASRLVGYLRDRPNDVEENTVEEVVEEVDEVVEEISEEDTDEEEDEPKEEKEKAEPISVPAYLDASVRAGLLVGQDEAELDAGTQAGEVLGSTLVAEGQLADQIADFGQMYEAMQVNIPNYLNQSRDREEALQDYQDQLNYLLFVARENEEDLRDRSDVITDEFVELEERKNALEERFFANLRDFDAYGSTGVLEAFIKVSEELVALRAHYTATEKLLSYYEVMIEAMELRIRDVELNEEALIKGVKVADIEGSDIDLIIDESEL